MMRNITPARNTENGDTEEEADADAVDGVASGIDESSVAPAADEPSDGDQA